MGYTEHMKQHNGIHGVLAAHGMKATEQRLTILSMFYSQEAPLSAEHIFTQVGGKGLDLATIYRTLTAFEKAGLIRRVDLRREAVHYERTDSHHHHHIVCEGCGKTEDFEICDVPQIAEKALKKSSFARVSTHSLELFGVCKKCAKA